MKTGTLRDIQPVFTVLFIIWFVFAVDMVIPAELNRFGIIPRHLSGLPGILFSPFLHGNLVHIVSNTVPFLVLGLTVFLFYTKKALNILVYSILISGTLVWIFGRPAIHIGLSGVIYALASFLVFAGIFQRQFLPLLISIVIIILYGGLIWGMIPGSYYVSWEGHIAGAVAGYLLAERYYRK